MAGGSALMAGDDRGRLEKIERIFRHFDADGDGGLDRREMAALVVALNPRLRFTTQQIHDIVHDVFRLYSKGAGGTGPRRVTLNALLCIYDDIAGDDYGDCDALGLGRLFRDTAANGPQSPSRQERSAASPDSLPPTECFSLASSTASSFRSDIDLFDNGLQSPSRQERRAASPDSVTPTECFSLASSTASSFRSDIDLFANGLQSPSRQVRRAASPDSLSPTECFSPSSSTASLFLSDIDLFDIGSQSPSRQERRAASPDSLPPTECFSLASSISSSFRSDIDLFDVGGGPPMSEYEEIPSYRWMSPSLYPQRGRWSFAGGGLESERRR